MKKLWETKTVALDPLVESFLSSIDVDKKLIIEDINGSIAHAAMLAKVGIIDSHTAVTLDKGLHEIMAEIVTGKLIVDSSAEDVHSFVEMELTKRYGDAGRALHAGRSRNDQVALDLRLYLRKASTSIQTLLLEVITSLATLAKLHTKTVMPGYTHLQRAQTVSFGHHMLAWASALQRDYTRLQDATKRANESPLGSGALASSGLPLDREATSAALGFAKPSMNSMDAVGDRDACVEIASACAIILMHLSRYAEEIILWSSSEFQFVNVGPSASTGSSIMPQKRNPDPAELIRGKTGRVFGNVTALLVLQKGLPLAYNRDLQEDKEIIFDSVDTTSASLAAFHALLDALEPNVERMRSASEAGCLWAADAAEFLVTKGKPFRASYAAAKALVETYLEQLTQLPKAGGIVADAQVLHIQEVLQNLGDSGLAAIHELWQGINSEELARYLDLEASLARRTVIGGPSPQRVAESAEYFLNFCASQKKK